VSSTAPPRPTLPTLRDRASGVLLHLTSLPGPHGSGDLGPQALGFADLLHAAGQRWWQVLPINPPGGGASPYQTLSVFAGSPALVALEPLVKRGWLDAHAVAKATPRGDPHHIDWPASIAFREAQLRHAHLTFEATATREERAAVAAFAVRERVWLDDFLLYAALKRAHDGAAWFDFPPALRRREPAALAAAAIEHASELDYLRFVQWCFDTQWRALRAHCAARGIALLGDVPIFVADDSADVWAHQELYFLGEDGRPTVVAGVPPDYFSETGQRWGNALYRWDVHAARGFSWWIERLRGAFSRFDAVRLDHFIGFQRYWEVPAEEPDARNGRFLPGPGRALFDAATLALGELPLIAEDLGVLTDEVKKLRDDLELPGMRVLQFAFGADAGSRDYRPHAYPRRSVAYTGTHDNDTTQGWFRDPTGDPAARALALRYLASDGREVHWDMIRMALLSPADLAIIPMQDVLGLGTDARTNTPGTTDGNWCWRMRLSDLAPDSVARLRSLTETYDRTPLR
jgi:4-alpha-glucanotransferase